ncbi:MAG: BsuPI-related putative proteinase inhibitor [Halopenitus sp.]
MLTATLSVTPTEDALELTIAVENEGDEAVELNFSDAQRAEFVADEIDSGKEVWRWSEGRMFGQVLGTEVLDPGDQLEYDVDWPDPPTGSYRVRGELVDNEHQPSAEMTVELP